MQHVPCLAHVINLTVQAMLGKGGLGAEPPANAESMDTEVDDDTDGLLCSPISDINVDNSGKSVADTASMKIALKKLRMGIVKIRYSSMLLSSL